MGENTAAMSFILSAAAAVIAENTVLTRGFGVSTALAAAKSDRNLLGTVLGVMYFTLMAALAACLLHGNGLDRQMASNELVAVRELFVPLKFVLMIGVIYIITLILLRMFSGRFFVIVKKYIHISAFNSAVMGTIFLSMSHCTDLKEYLVFGLFAGAGFGLTACMLSAVYSRLCSSEVPAVFRGFPAIMIYLGIIAMAVYGILGRTPSYL